VQGKEGYGRWARGAYKGNHVTERDFALGEQPTKQRMAGQHGVVLAALNVKHREKSNFPHAGL
jgi:hypothetical protein